MDYSLVEKLLGKPFISVKEVLGRQMQFRVLSNPERVQIWKRYPAADLLTAPEVIAIPTLARAITSIDGIPWEQFTEIKELRKARPGATVPDLVEQHLSDTELYAYTVINEMYMAYTQVVDDHQKVLDGLKKNSSPLSHELSGSSVGPSTVVPTP